MTTIRHSLAKAIAALAVASALGAAANAAETITLGTVGSGSALNWPLLIAMEKGYFEKSGVVVDLVTAPSSAAVQQQVASGSVDMGSGGLVDPIRAIDKGADLSIIRIEANAAPYALFVKPEIKDYAALKGRTVMVGGAKDITRIYLERMTGPNGLKPADYDLLYAGATSARFAALQSGAVDGALLTSPFNFKAEAAGLKNLGVTVDYVRDFPFTGYAINKTWARSHKPALVGFLKAYSEGVAWLGQAENHNEAIEILIRKTAAQKDDAEKTYDFFKTLNIYSVDGKIDEKGLGNLLSVMKELGDLEGAPEVSRFYDPTLLAKD